MKPFHILSLGACLLLATITVCALQSPFRKPESSDARPAVNPSKDSHPASEVATSPNNRPQKNVDAFGKYVADSAPQGTPQDRTEAEARLRGDLRVEAEGPGRYRIGPVTLDSTRRTVTLPATVNMDTGAVEYALVTESGKVHEAIFSTAANPMQIHLACLLLGVSPEKADAAPSTPRQVRVTVTWETNGPPAEHDLSQMVVQSEDPIRTEGGSTLPLAPWNYTGSVMDAHGFAAAREGSIISLISDQAALLNSSRPDARRDDHHFPNKALVPPKGSPVRIVLTLPEPGKD
jgi:hypothetical protein